MCPKDSRWWWWRTRPLSTRRANWCVHCVGSANPHQAAILTHMSSPRGRSQTWPSALSPRTTERASTTGSRCRKGACAKWQTYFSVGVFYCVLFRCVAGAVPGTCCSCGFERFGRAAACGAVLADGRLGTLPFPGLTAGTILHFCRMRLDARKPFSGTCQCRVACRDERVSAAVKRAAPVQSCACLKVAQRVSPALEGRLAHRAGVDVDADSTLSSVPLVLNVTWVRATRCQRKSQRRVRAA